MLSTGTGPLLLTVMGFPHVHASLCPWLSGGSDGEAAVILGGYRVNWYAVTGMYSAGTQHDLCLM